MPTFPCPDCNHQCSTLALACPNCGRPLQQANQDDEFEDSPYPDLKAFNSQKESPSLWQPEQKKKHYPVWIVGGIIALVIAVIFFVINLTPTRNVNSGVGNQQASATQNVSPTPQQNPQPVQEANSNHEKDTETPSKVAVRLRPLVYIQTYEGKVVPSGNHWGLPVTLITSSGHLTRKIGKALNTYMQFENVPCGETIKIILSDKSFAEGYWTPKSYSRFVDCGKPVIDLGDFKLVVAEAD